MKVLYLSLLLFISAADIYSQSTITGTIQHGGINRSYRLRLPSNHNKAVPIPLVFNFHGFSSNAAQQEIYSNMNAVADTARFAVCYPEGISSAWNVGWTFGSTADDIGFTSAMIDELNLKYGIDKSRVYACGMSNGGFMSYVLACRLNDRIAAIASVTGSMVPGSLATCQPGKSVPVMEIHGTADATVEYNGTAQISLPIPTVLEFWQKNNGCDESPFKENVPDKNTSDGTTTEKYTYTNCKDGSQMIHFKVLNGAHTWPGAFINIGTTSQDFSASLEIWKFFRRFKLNNISASDDNKIITPEIFPNPFNELVTVRLPVGEGSFVASLLDISGALISKHLLSAELNTLDTSELPVGMYFLAIKNNSQTSIQKIIKL